MRQLISYLFIFFVVLGFLINTAEAARFGGGRSFGVQRSLSSFSRQQQPAGRLYAQNRPRSSWAAPLAGLALGSLLGYLLMGHGFSSGLLSWLIILSIGLMVWNFLRSRAQIAAQSVRLDQNKKARVFEAQESFARTNEYSSVNQAPSYPPGFDPEVFLRDAKVQFIRLQAAYDNGDLKDLREFTAPEVFAEIQMQLHERGQKMNHTEVISLNADLLNLNSENQHTLATVKFSGVLREEKDAPSSFFEENWHFCKDERNKWLVVGVQQNLH